MRKFSVIFFLVHFCYALIGQNILITDDFKSTYVGVYTDFYEDSYQEETITTILSKPTGDWKNQKVPVIRLGNSSSAFWCRFTLENKTRKTKQLTIALEYPQPDYVQFYRVENGVLKDSSILMGDLFPFTQRLIEHRYYVYNYELPPNRVQTIYCKSGQLGGKFYLPLKVYHTPEWFYKNNTSVLSYGLIIGIVFIISAIAFILFLLLHKPYALFITLQNIALLFFFLGFSGLGFQYVWPDAYYYQQSCTRFPIVFFSIFKLLFLLSFFDFKKIRHLYYFFIVNVLFLFFVTIILTIATFNYSSVTPTQMRWMGWGAYGSGGLAIVSSFIASFFFYKKTKNQDMLWYLRLSLFQILVVVLSSFTYFSNIGLGNFKSGDAAILSCIVEGLIVSFIIINHYKQTLLDKKQLTLDLTNKQNEALNNLLKGQEEERKRLSQELHDGLSIQLLNIKSALRKFMEETPTTQPTSLPKVVKDLDTVQTDLRNLSHALNPFVLQEYGLKKAINEIIFSAEMNDPELDIQFNFAKELSLMKETEKHFYYIIQELFNNTLKYANASKIVIDLKNSNEKITLQFKDNGKGYDIKEVKNSGIGLKNIQSIVDLLNGTFKIIPLNPTGVEHQIVILIKT